MSTYSIMLLFGIGTGALLNAYSPRSLSVCFFVYVLLFLAPTLIPSPDILNEIWFPVLIGAELSLCVLAILSESLAGSAVALFCGWNIAGNLAGWASYSWGWSFYDYYSPIIQAGETFQVISLIVMSRPILNLAVMLTTKKKGTKNGWHYHLSHPG